jgi:molybdate transport system ATP-binding protein
MGKPFCAVAVVYGAGDDVDAALSAAMAELVLADVAIGGLLQRFGKQVAPGKREMLLDILPDGETIRLNDPRGPGVQGCILDSDALMRAATAFRDAAEARPDLLLASRFGKEEVAGHGLRAELAEVLIAGIPLLIPVRINLLPDWIAFLGAPGEVLAPTPEAILGWAAAKRVGVAARPAVAIGW